PFGPTKVSGTPRIAHVQSTPHRQKDSRATYLCGNSLGLASKRAKKLVQEELDVWAKRSVAIHGSLAVLMLCATQVPSSATSSIATEDLGRSIATPFIRS